MTEQGASQKTGILLACLTAAIWGFLAIILKTSLHLNHLVGVIWFRFLFSFLSLVVFYSFRDPSKLRIFVEVFRDRRTALWGLAAGALLGFNYYAYVKGMALTSVNNVQVLVQFGPILLAFAGIVIFRERILWHQGLGLLVVGIGFLLFYRVQLEGLVAEASRYHAGNLWILAAASSWAVWGVFQKRLVLRWNPQQANLLVYGLAALMFTPFFSPSKMMTFDVEAWGTLAFLGVSTVIGYGFLAEALRRAPANQVSLIVSLNPIFTLVIMALLAVLQVSWVEPETLPVSGWVGAILLVVGVALVSQRDLPFKVWLRNPDL